MDCPTETLRGQIVLETIEMPLPCVDHLIHQHHYFTQRGLHGEREGQIHAGMEGTQEGEGSTGVLRVRKLLQVFHK